MTTQAVYEHHPLRNPLKTELTKGYWAGTGVPEYLIVSAGKLQIAKDLVELKLARWGQDELYGSVLQALPELWNEIQALDEIQAS